MTASEQAKAIKDRIAPMLAYLQLLTARIDFLPDDLTCPHQRHQCLS